MISFTSQPLYRKEGTPYAHSTGGLVGPQWPVLILCPVALSCGARSPLHIPTEIYWPPLYTQMFHIAVLFCVFITEKFPNSDQR